MADSVEQTQFLSFAKLGRLFPLRRVYKKLDQFTAARAARVFKRVRMRTGAFEVTNIKTLEGKVATLEGLVRSVARSVDDLSGTVGALRDAPAGAGRVYEAPI